MFCQKCGTAYDDTMAFCPNCGVSKPDATTQNDSSMHQQPQQNEYQQPQQNEYQQNGYQQNGYQQNEYQQNGYQQPQQNGYQQNGYQQPQQNGYQQNGYQQNGYQQNWYQQNGSPTQQPVEKYAALFGVLGYFIPILGIVLFFILKDENPKSAKSALIGSIISLAIGAIFFVIWLILAFTVTSGVMF